MSSAKEKFTARREEALGVLRAGGAPEARRDAAATLEKELLGVVNQWTEEWVKTGEARSLLAALVRDEDPDVAGAALVGLVQLVWCYKVDYDLRPAIEMGLAHDAPKIRRWALEGMSFVSDTSFWERVTPLTTDKAPVVRVAAMAAIERMVKGGATISDATRAAWLAAVKLAAKDRSGDVRRAATAALKAFKSKS